MSARHLVLVRHGESAYNAEGRLQGQSDAPLSALGRDQARGLVAVLAALPPMHVVCSDLSRARDTAALAGHPDAEPDRRWRERGLGIWEDRLEAEVDPQRMRHFRATDDPPEGGEGWAALQARVGDAIADLEARGGSWLVFTHGGCVRAAVAHLTGADPRTVAGPGNASLTVLEHGSHWRLRAFNWFPAEGGALRLGPASDPGGARPPVRSDTTASEPRPDGAQRTHAEP